MNAGLQVSIAPIIDLHTGYHGAMIDSAIAGVSIKPRHATHVFIHQANWNFSGYPESGVGFRVYGCCSSHFKRRILVLEPRTSMLS